MKITREMYVIYNMELEAPEMATLVWALQTLEEVRREAGNDTANIRWLREEIESAIQ